MKTLFEFSLGKTSYRFTKLTDKIVGYHSGGVILSDFGTKDTREEWRKIGLGLYKKVR